MTKRCPWCGNDPLYMAYHDEEWGVPLHDDRALFELLVLEGAQAGLAWITVLRKRLTYRQAFDNFDIDKVAGYGDKDMERLLSNPGIVRNRVKIASAIHNARCVQAIQAEFGSLAGFLWGFVEGRPIRNAWRSVREVPVTTPEAEAMSRVLKKRGLKFVGPTICYAYMQSAGLVNDHLVDCFRHESER
ncbi:MAG: DNA-3-methyladenine glycosylase I [Proteobacteria bacterium]|nr:DNA-3-methyladenine glycosylase I [Pseudomonadota bacterium]